jgi:chemotaxis family two-component system sensor kinase Cph1
MNIPGLLVQFKKYGLGLIIAWTCILAAILSFITHEYHTDTIKEATREARDYHSLNLHYRRWAAKIGGVYAFSDKVSPNQHLRVPDRDVTTDSGKALTLVNPAYMTRMVFETIQKDSTNPIINRLVSLKPLNPANTPNAWEQESLKLFENSKSRERTQLLKIDERPYLQFMAAFITEESCLKCHAHQGYKTGDIRGGMSIAIPISEYLAIEAERRQTLAGGLALLWVLGSAGIVASSTRRHRQEMKIVEEKSRLEEEVCERQQIQEQLEDQTLRLEEEITERHLAQEHLEEQATMLEEESAERQQALVALQKVEHFLHAIIDSEPECVKLLDAGRNLLMMNRAGLEMLEAESFEQVQGQCVCTIVNEPYRNAFEEFIRTVFQGNPGSLEFEITGLKGRRLWLNTMAVPFRDENGTIVAALAIARNITELKKTGDELKLKNADMEQFIYTVSHDLRSPLVTVKTFLGFLENDMAADDPERVSQDLAYIHGAADKMELLLNELLELSRLDRVEAPAVRISLIGMVDEVLGALAGVINERKVRIHRPEIDLELFGDRQRMCRIWQNLIENAIKYGCIGDDPLIELGVQQVNGVTVFFVKDNGVGIAPEYRKKIFEMFEKLDQKSPGAGLGLSMVKRIVDKCGGKIWIESDGVGNGACFFFTLPLAVIQS